MDQGDTPTVLAITNGKGDIRDAVLAVMLDEVGNIRTQTKFDNLKDELEKASFIELVERRKPQVVVIGGLSVHTAKLRDDAAIALRELACRKLNVHPPTSDQFASQEEYTAAVADFDLRIAPSMTPLIFASDATARMYMRSDEAEKEHPTLPINGRYALALARYVQNPLNAYCKLGRHITSVTFQEHHQKLVCDSVHPTSQADWQISQEKLLLHLERGLVNSVCFMGIEINSCVGDPYQRAMLPFIAGLGPRKADALVNGVQRNVRMALRMS